ncbi:MAG: hypothetical protein IJ856_05535 [Candidatus Methanomethylophilaceae archaeon]|nr:hypothetical protein [Candidatus Methanomethylophilaceae archaeon]
MHGATAIYAPEYECARARGLSILTFARYVFDNRNISSAAFRVHRLMAGLECSTREYATVPETEGRVDLRLQALYAHIDRSVTMYMLAESGEDLVSGCGFTSKDLSTLMGNLLEAESYRDAIRIFDAYRGIADEGCVGMLSKALVLLHDKRSRSEGIRLIRRYSESYDLGDDALRLSEEDPGDDPDMSSQDTLTRDGVSRYTK